MKLFIYIMLFLSATVALAQNQGNIWYFGEKAGIDFNNNGPRAITDGQLDTDEGCSSICDKYGKLLFYTDGISVWHRNHGIMPNGQDLMGHRSATQSGVIVPKPLDSTFYYIFTVDDKLKTGSFRYSTVDLTLNGGLGDIVDKNILLCDSSTEKVTAVKHSNKRDIWVIMHEWATDTFQVHLITPDGINGIENSEAGYPIKIAIGTEHKGTVYNKIGYLKASSDGTKLALTIYDMGVIEIFDFNDTTGQISNPITIRGDKYLGAYGVEFSDDCSKLYISYHGIGQSRARIEQYDLEATDVEASGVTIYSNSMPQSVGALQIGPDKKIYASIRDESYLAVINNPDEKGSLCDFNANGVSLSGRMPKLGLPTFIQSIFSMKLELTATSPICEGEDIELTCNEFIFAEYNWIGPGGYFSKEQNPVIKGARLNNAGMYYVTVQLFDYIKTDSIEVEVNPWPNFDLGDDIGICDEDEVQIGEEAYGSAPPYEYQWSPLEGLNDDTSPIVIAKPTKTTAYELTVTDSKGCVNRDTITITVYPKPRVEIGEDFEICYGDSVLIGAPAFNGTEPYLYKWTPSKGLESDNESQVLAYPEITTEYIVDIVDVNGCVVSDTILITVNDNPTIEFPEDKTICYGDSVALTASISYGEGPYEYSWSPANSLDDNSAPNPTAAPLKTTTYYLTITDQNGCIDRDSTIIYVEDNLIISFPEIIDSYMPGDIFTAPLRIDLVSGSKQTFDIQYVMAMRFNSTVLAPVGNDLSGDTLIGEEREITLSGMVSITDANQAVIPVNFFVALGNSDSIALEIMDFQWLNSICGADSLISGSVVAGVCEEGGKRLLNPGKYQTTVQIYPNPASDNCKIEISNLAEDPTKIYLTDMIGLEKKMLFEGIPNDINVYFTLKTDQLPSGTYILVVQTIRSTKAYKFRIIN